jgi:hypothetical protein
LERSNFQTRSLRTKFDETGLEVFLHWKDLQETLVYTTALWKALVLNSGLESLSWLS